MAGYIMITLIYLIAIALICHVKNKEKMEQVIKAFFLGVGFGYESNGDFDSLKKRLNENGIEIQKDNDSEKEVI